MTWQEIEVAVVKAIPNARKSSNLYALADAILRSPLKVAALKHTFVSGTPFDVKAHKGPRIGYGTWHLWTSHKQLAELLAWNGFYVVVHYKTGQCYCVTAKAVEDLGE